MSLIDNNPLLKGISGMLGKTIVFRRWRGRLVVAKAPKKRDQLSELQEAQVSRFTLAGQYARQQMLDPEAKAEYATGIRRNIQSAYHAAQSDYLNAPKVRYINAEEYTGASGELIVIKAIDDFKVTRVSVEIVDPNGEVLERGDAVPYFRKSDLWKYHTSMVNPSLQGTVIRATAYDKPGNKGCMEQVL
jgi:hypothetical protein